MEPRQTSLHPWRTLIVIGAVAMLLYVLAAPVQASVFKGKYPMKIGATVGMVADIAREVAGDQGQVTGIIGAGVDPHVYNPTRGDVAVLLKSDIIFYAGLLLEGQMADILVKVAKRRPVYAVTELLQTDYLIHDDETQHNDPHVWMDVQGWIKAVEVVEKALSEFDPQGAAVYQKNGTAYRQRLQALDDYAKKSSRLHSRRPAYSGDRS